MSVQNLRLERLEESNWRQALEVRPRPDQLSFVAECEPVALVILSKCYLRPGGLAWEPFGIVANRKMVGVFALTHAATRCKLYHFLIDRTCQNLGYGRAAMKAIIDHLREDRPSCADLALTVHPHNEPARRLYGSFGFQDTGEAIEGEPLWRLALSD